MAHSNSDPLTAARWALSEARSDSAAFSEALCVVGRFVGAESVNAFVPALDARIGYAEESITWNISLHDDGQAFAREHGCVDPWTHTGVSKNLHLKSAIHLGEELATESDWARSPWSRFHGPNGLHHLMTQVDPGQSRHDPALLVSFYRSAAAGGTFTEAERAALALVRADLSDAARVRLALRRAGMAQAFALSALEALPEAALLLTPSGALIWANAHGDALMDRGGPLILRRAILLACAPQATERLAAAVAACARGASQTVALPHPAGRSLILRLSCLQQGGQTAILALARTATEPDQSEALKLKAIFGLSATEAEVALALCDNKTPRAIAHHRGVSVETVRSQIKSMLAKLGCTRQLEAVRLIDDALR